MEIIQTYIPDVPLWKDAGILTLSTTTKSGFMDFLRKNGILIFVILIVSIIVGSIIYAYQKSRKEDRVRPNQDTKQVLVYPQNQ